MPRKAKQSSEPPPPRRVTRRSVQVQSEEAQEAAVVDTCKAEASSSKVVKTPSKKAASPAASTSSRVGRSRRTVAAQEEPQAAGDQIEASDEAPTKEAVGSPAGKATGRKGRRGRGATGKSPEPSPSSKRKRAEDAAAENEQKKKRVKLSEEEEAEEGRKEEEMETEDTGEAKTAEDASGSAMQPEDGESSVAVETTASAQPAAACEGDCLDAASAEVDEPSSSVAAEPAIAEAKEPVDSAGSASVTASNESASKAEPADATVQSSNSVEEPVVTEAVQPNNSESTAAVSQNGISPNTDPAASTSPVTKSSESPSKKAPSLEEVDDYEVVNMTEMPAHSSAAVQEALPTVNPPSTTENRPSTTENCPSTEPVIQPQGEMVFGAMLSRKPPPPSAPPSTTTDPAPSTAPAPSAAPASNDPLFSRHFVSNKTLPGASTPVVDCQFTVASYNVLAECHALRDARTGQSYQWISADRLLAESRHVRLIAELKFLGADVVCLQEIGPDYFTTTLKPAMNALGYEGVMMKRSSDAVDEGEATFVRSNRFKIIESRSVVLAEVAIKDLDQSQLSEQTRQCVRSVVSSPAVTLLSKLCCRQSNAVLSVANIHVSFERFQRPDLQCVEVGCAIRELVKFAGGQDTAHIICGDFNSVSTSPIYQMIQDGSINALSKAKLQALPTVHVNEKVEPLSNLWDEAFQHTAPGLRSAYETTTGSNPMTSTFPHDSVLRGVDYLWYASEQLDVMGVLETAPADLIKDGIPNEVFPSDHLSLKAQFCFK